MYCKGLASCPPKMLILDECLLELSKIKINYFKILDVYINRNNEVSMEDILDLVFAGSPETIR